MGGVGDFIEGTFRPLVFGKDTGPRGFQQKTVTQEEKDRLLAEYDKTLSSSSMWDKPVLTQQRQSYADSLVVPPPPPPDPAAEAVRKAAALERRRQAITGGGATFRPGPALPSALPTLPRLTTGPLSG